MTNIPHFSEKESTILDFVAKFFAEFHVGNHLRTCNAGKEKGVPLMDVFRYLFCLAFMDRSMYMQMKTGTFKENFCKNTVYRLLNGVKTNWQRFTTLLSAEIILNFIKPLTSEDRKDVFIIDDSLHDHSRSKKTELMARVFDHCDMKYKKGFRMLTLGWSDGSTFLPINHILLSTAEDKNLLCEAKTFDSNSIAGKRREQARKKAPDAMLELISAAIKAKITAKYVLFDSWFSSPKTIRAIKEGYSLDTIAMVKKSKTRYKFKEDMLNLKEIYSRNKKRRGRSKYLLSVIVTLPGNTPISAKLVFVRNKSNKKDWLALISTDTSLSEEEIIRIYGKRWDIEVFFKTCKSYLKLVKGTRSISYDGITAHTSIVFARYMMLAVAKRRDIDQRSLGELFFFMQDELEDITFNASLRIITEALIATVMEFFHITETQLHEFMQTFINNLPKEMKKALQYDVCAA